MQGTLTERNAAFPRRHASQPDAWMPFVRKLRLFFPKRQLPDPELCNTFGELLSVGDPAMDTLVEWMRLEGLSKTKPLFLTALEQGLDAIPHPPQPLRDFFEHIETRPRWVDEQQLQQGCEAHAMLGDTLAHGLRDFVLMGGYLSSSINEVLALSGGLTSGVVKRLAETSRWNMDITEPGGLERFAPGFIATIRVRWVHALVRNRIADMPQWDQSLHGLPANQTDMIATWLGFAIGGPLSAMLLGKLVLSPSDLRAYLHLYKYAHWLMGVAPEFLSDDPTECAWLLANNTLTQPGPSNVSKQMAQALGAHKREQNYSNLPGLRGRWEQQLQLDRSRYFLGQKSMRELGLSSPRLPILTWAPLPLRAISSTTQRFLLPRQRQRLIREGRAQQRAFVNALYAGNSREWSPESASALGSE